MFIFQPSNGVLKILFSRNRTIANSKPVCNFDRVFIKPSLQEVRLDRFRVRNRVRVRVRNRGLELEFGVIIRVGFLAGARSRQ